MSYVFGTKDGGYTTSLDMITGGLGNVLTIDQDTFEWGVMIDQDRAVTIRQASWNGVIIDSANYESMTPGLGNTPVTLWLEDAWLASTELRLVVIR